MKTLKLFNRFLTLVMVLTAIAFSSCSKDEEPETGEQPTEDAGGRRLVSKMEYSSPEDGDWVVRFFYNKDGSLQKVTNDVDELSEVTFTRIDNRLTVRSDYGSDGVETLIYALNDEGCVTSFINGGEGSPTFEYQNAFLDNGHFGFQTDWKATWQNGDLLKVVDNGTTNYTYTNKENKMNVELFDSTFPDLFEYTGEFCMTSGYWGKKNKHLLKKAEEIWDSGAAGSSYEYSYEFDSKGYVTQILLVYKEWGRGTKESTWTSTVTVTYAE